MNKEYLEDKTIYDLRTLARELGVKHPSMLKKKELIDNIIKINNGLINSSNEKRGRKPRSKLDFSIVEKKGLTEYQKEEIFNLIEKLKQDIINLIK